MAGCEPQLFGAVNNLLLASLAITCQSLLRRIWSARFSIGRTGADVAGKRASTVARTLKVLKGCILQQQSAMRARASGTSQSVEGTGGDGFILGAVLVFFVYIIIFAAQLHLWEFQPQRPSGQAVGTGVVPSPPPPQYVPSFLSRIRLIIPTCRFASNFANPRSRTVGM